MLRLSGDVCPVGEVCRKSSGKSRDIALYGQELTATTYKLAKMNLAIRGLSANLGERPADTFFSDQHPDLKADSYSGQPAV